MSDRSSERDAAIEAARRRARIDLLPAQSHTPTETAVFDVVVDGLGLIGRWAQINKKWGAVTWTDGSKFETGGCDGDPVKIIAAVRMSIPMQPQPVQPKGPGRSLPKLPRHR